MKYLCLVYGEENRMATIDDRECMACASGLEDSGHLIAGQALERVSSASTLRVRDGKVTVTDGPFAETKEQLAGFYLLEARDMNEALDKAAKIPPARIGSIEIRPVRELNGGENNERRAG